MPPKQDISKKGEDAKSKNDKTTQETKEEQKIDSNTSNLQAQFDK